jgi:AraC-like DNA-binding protein
VPRHALDDAYVLLLQLQTLAAKPRAEASDPPHTSQAPGTICLVDPSVTALPEFSAPFDCLVFHLPKAAFREVAAQLDLPAVETFRCSPAAPAVDHVVYALGRSLLPILSESADAGREFAEHVLRAVTIHVLQTYGDATLPAESEAVLGLEAAQLALAKRMLSAPLERVMVGAVAAACGLSASHFSRLFLRSTGLTPHRWQTQSRIEHSKELLRTSGKTLTEVAAACGFADQSHFSRVFRSIVGATPGDFRAAFLAASAPALPPDQ